VTRFISSAGGVARATWSTPANAHDHARRVGGGAARGVDADPVERPEPPAEFAAPRLPVAERRPPVRRQLPFVELPDVRRGRLDRRADVGVDGVVGALGVVGHVEVPDLDAVQLTAVLPDRDVALGPDSLDDLPGVGAGALDPGVPIEQGRPLVGREIRDRPHFKRHTARFGAAA
jgi:hypothetical protein